MKKIILLLIAFVNFVSLSNAQWQQTTMTSQSVKAISISGNNIFAGSYGAGVFLSQDNGTSWTAVNSGLSSLWVNALANSGNKILAGTDNGVFLSTNNGTNWTSISTGLPNSSIHAIATDGINLFAGTQNGIYRSTNNGGNWSLVGNYNTYAFAISGSNIYAGCGNGVVLSSDTGSTWTVLNMGVSTPVYSLLIDGNNILASGHGVYQSSDSGVSWIFTGLSNAFVDALALNGNNVYSATSALGVYSASLNGISWTDVSTGLANLHVYSLAVKNDTLFAGTAVGVSKCYAPNLPITNCSALFSVVPDTNVVFHYGVNNHAAGVAPITYHWDWGDGAHDSIANPSHTFSNSGYYNVCQTITDNAGCTSTFCDTIHLTAPPCQASFLDSINNDTVAFYGFENDPTNTFSWTFGDGTTSTLMNPVHIYANSGSYHVCVTINTMYGCSSSACNYITIVAPTNCSALFTLFADSIIPLHYYIINYATGTSPIHYMWSWGDGTYDSIANPVHTYSNTGFYYVCQTITDNIGCSSTVCDSVNISVPPCQASFLDTINNYSVSFYVFDNNPTNTFSWTFGDGGTSTLMNPVHVYANPGNYTVCLTITSIYGCTNNVCHSIHINSLPADCNAYFTYAQSGLPFNYLFSDSSTTIVLGAIVNSWNWVIKDSLQNILFTSNLQNTNFIFPGNGIYDVCLNMTTDSGCADTVCYNIYVQDSIPAACLLNVSATISNVTVTGGNDGYINLAVTGGYPPYTFSWNNGTTTEDISGLTSGTYIVFISQSGGYCPVTTDTFQIIEPYLGIPIDTLYSATIDTCLNFVPDSFYVSNISVMDSLVTATWVFMGGGISDTFHVTYVFGNYGNYVVVITINCAKSMVSYMAHVNVASYLDIENESVQKPSIYPNPFTGLLNVKLPTGLLRADIRIYNYTGQTIYQARTYDTNTTIDASKWTNGIYFISVSDGNNTMMTSKMIKQ